MAQAETSTPRAAVRPFRIRVPEEELVGMLTIEDVGQASLLRPLPRQMSRIDNRANSQETASR